jgi:hypothetical protein
MFTACLPLIQGCILALIMPIPALSKSYKPRLQAEKAHDGTARKQVKLTAISTFI